MDFPNGIFLFYSLLAKSNIVSPTRFQKKATELSWKYWKMSKWLNLMAFLGTADSEVHIVHISHVIIAYTLEVLKNYDKIDTSLLILPSEKWSHETS